MAWDLGIKNSNFFFPKKNMYIVKFFFKNSSRMTNVVVRYFCGNLILIYGGLFLDRGYWIVQYILQGGWYGWDKF